LRNLSSSSASSFRTVSTVLSLTPRMSAI
jgi:hypothetical protein